MTSNWFISTKYQFSAKLSILTFLLALLVVLLGAYTRLTDAGLSCPDWPNCYGYLTAPHTPSQLAAANQHYPLSPVNVKKAWTEMTHRYLAGCVGLLILSLAVPMIFFRRGKSMVFGISLLFILSIQVSLGMLTVTEKLKPMIVVAHLLTGLSLLCVLWWTTLDLNWRHDFFRKKIQTKIKPWLLFGFILLALQISLGGWVSTHYAGLACIDFPYCQGKLLPEMAWQHLNTDLISIHMLHRIGAVITTAYLIVLSFFLWRYQAMRHFVGLIVILLGIQISLGIFNILWLRPVWLALLHHGVAILLLLTLLTALAKASLIMENRI